MSSFFNAGIQEDAVDDSDKRATIENERHYSRQLVVVTDTNVNALLRRSDVCASNANGNSDGACDCPEPENGEEEENISNFVPYCRDSKEEKKGRGSLGENIAYPQGKLKRIAIGNISRYPTSQCNGAQSRQQATYLGRRSW